MALALQFCRELLGHTQPRRGAVGVIAIAFLRARTTPSFHPWLQGLGHDTKKLGNLRNVFPIASETLRKYVVKSGLKG